MLTLINVFFIDWKTNMLSKIELSNLRTMDFIKYEEPRKGKNTIIGKIYFFSYGHIPYFECIIYGIRRRWEIKNLNLYSIPTNEEIMLYQLENS